jgi:CMP-N,N'-diacetyllegionaminic acid synthase
MTELLIMVPARGGSKRLPGKNLRKIAGRSLLEHTAEAVAQSGLSAPVMLTTDDTAIADEGRRLGWIVPFMRPAELAMDHVPTIDVVLHLLDWHQKNYGDPTMVMVLQPTSPLRSGKVLAEAVARMRNDATIDSIIGMRAVHLPAAAIFTLDQSGAAQSIRPDDHRRPCYLPNGALYLTRATALRRERSLYAGRIVPQVMDDMQSVDIDTEIDLRIAEALYDAGLGAGAQQAEPVI